MSIRVSVEGGRGCGTRKPGGLYLVSGQLSEPCPLLPLPLDRCPHCGQGVGPARGWTWITPAVLFPAVAHGTALHTLHCPMGIAEDIEIDPTTDRAADPTYHRTGDRAGLIWIGEQFYPTPEAFMAEAATMGVSRRVKAVPRGFEIGRDWVYLAHRKAVPPKRGLGSVLVGGDVEDTKPTPGVMTLFKPTAIEYVVKGDETDEEIASLEERGIQPVKVLTPEEAAQVPA